MKKMFLALALAALAAPALAGLQLSANINGNVFTCIDNAACDTNPLVGQLQIANAIFGGVEVLGSAQTQSIGATNFLNTSSFQIINHNTSAVNIILAIGGINFAGPVSQFSASGSGTWQNAGGSSIGLTWWGDTANSQGADNPTDLPGVMLASFNDIANGASDAFAYNTAGPFLDPNLFSMSLGTTGTLAAWNGVAGQEATLVGRSQALVATQVPEPGTLALMGLAFAGLGFSRKHA